MTRQELKKLHELLNKYDKEILRKKQDEILDDNNEIQIKAKLYASNLDDLKAVWRVLTDVQYNIESEVE